MIGQYREIQMEGNSDLSNWRNTNRNKESDWLVWIIRNEK